MCPQNGTAVLKGLINSLIHPAACSALPRLILPCSPFPWFALPCPALPCPALPCLAMSCRCLAFVSCCYGRTGRDVLLPWGGTELQRGRRRYRENQSGQGMRRIPFQERSEARAFLRLRRYASARAYYSINILIRAADTCVRLGIITHLGQIDHDLQIR